MTKEPGRNELCTCGSGKKYKDCCYRKAHSFAVAANPLPGEPRNTYSVQGPDGEWEKHPGSMLIQIHGEASDTPDAQLRDSFDLYLNRLKSRQDLAERVHDCRHKCRAANYHFRAIRTEIEQQVKRYEEEHKAQSGAAFVWRNEILLYEMEAFLFQTKSAIDMLIRVLNPIVPAIAKFDSFRGKKDIAGGAVLEVLAANEPALYCLFEDARQTWIQELKEWRDRITHVSELDGFTFFVENQYHSGPYATVEYPKMPSGRRLDEYCSYITDRLAELTQCALDELVRRAGNGQSAKLYYPGRNK